MLELALRREIRETLWFDLLAIFAGAGLVAALSRLSFPLPFSPVPLTGQTLGVLLVGAALGSRRGFLSLMTYLAAGASGLPVFAMGGAGPGWLMGPTGGYLMSFPMAAALVGFLVEKGWGRNFLTALSAMILASLVIYLVGAGWLAAFVPDPVKAGVLPFIPGDAVKIVLAASLVFGSGRGLAGEHST
jgi:biotin transport system substrate-specific component